MCKSTHIHSIYTVQYFVLCANANHSIRIYIDIQTLRIDNIPCTLYIVQCIVYIVHSVKFTIYSVHSV